MLPADQSLRANHLAGAHVHLGLVVENKLAGRQRLANVLQILMPAAYSLVVIGIEDMEAVSARELGLIHRLVGLAQQQVRIHFAWLRIIRHADARRYAQTEVTNLNRLRRSLP